MSQDLVIVNSDLVINDVQIKAFVKHHATVSAITTPKHEVQKRPDGYEYVEAAYMRKIANENYPGWSWVIQKYEFLGDKWIIIHGRLTFVDKNGVIRAGDMVAGHRIQHKKDAPDEYVDISNDVKSANTDCLKKAFNLYMNIADDIYRWESSEPATDEDLQTLHDMFIKLGMDRQANMIMMKALTKKEFEEKKAQLEKELKK